MKKLAYIVMIVITALFSAPSAARKSSQKTIVITAIPTPSQWVSHISADLTNNVDSPHIGAGFQMPEGLVSVLFVCDESGRPANIVISRSSRSSPLDQAAIRSVKRLTLNPMPREFPVGQRVRANIIFANTQYNLDNIQAHYLRQTAPQFAAEDRQNSVVAITLSPLSRKRS